MGMIKILECEDEDDWSESRFSSGSLSCLFPSRPSFDSPRKSTSFNKLQPRPLRLAVLRLDGSSFEIEVAKTGTVGELKRAVEAAFSHLPKEGPGKVSWEHVWGKFCLCHEGQKLLTESDCIRMFGIRDGDQLQFIHHDSSTDNSVVQSGKEDPDTHKEPHMDEEDGSEEVGGYYKDEKEGDDLISRCEYRLAHLLRLWFPYRKLPSSDM